ncbi:MAG: peptidoglycan-associated lipoprotein Pal [Rhodocyclaceae bacterium]|nr:peptidoglycan-associated lipoprotein Pal [Rhodocyclaceae bacterium]
MRKLFFVSASSIACLIAGCGTQPAAPEQAAAGVEVRTPSAVGTQPAQTTPVAPPPATDPYGLAALKDPASPLAKRSIYFDYDSFVIKDEFKPLLEHHARFLQKNASIKMLIQGNADERGSREYNLALGQKRAEAVKKALLLLGAQEEQIESVSLGEEKPVCLESNEACWAKNRRADLLYSGEF